MVFDGETLEIPIDGSIEELAELFDFVRSRGEYIETIRLDAPMDTMSTSSLLAFLYSIKHSYPELPIEGFDTGSCESGMLGTLTWSEHE